mmetsp:Transcript_30259/g.84556  ORF Transcript_30259/g.84556 Transcript_30259/m.84556 type:complete len:509 (+) Transcript_30259:69-1595(+)|eukprot:CAMPEP_0119119206 /NCGR_PEP_ID=MMETSP1310-20130426/794_1 /TAXON_ID=464262 /ORGANISM="Genus nov. species nov., Strain RCC2339" /LENGTH=508 /DNA_ID=CAMNT_0007108625 /DNA_START=69 /DNA_END=1595 /DNA_ORIENTATION=+
MKVAVILAAMFVVAAMGVKVFRTPEGIPKALYGGMGAATERSAQGAREWLASKAAVSALQLKGDEKFRFRNEQSFGGVHTYRFDQIVNGLEVFGGQLNVHLNDAGVVTGVTGIPLAAARVPAPHEVRPFPADFWKTLEENHGHAGLRVLEEPTMRYFVEDEHIRLGYYARVQSRKEVHPSWPAEPFEILVDGQTGRLAMDIPVYRGALERYIYDTQHSEELPGVLVRSEGEAPVSDESVDQAYDNAGYCYNYYWDKFRRDSYDNEGSPMVSTVHYGVDYANAFWNGDQMVYGDGDGVTFGAFTNDLTVICHELTHAVTQYTSGLIYWKESGALNEAFSDIMGSSATVYTFDSASYLDPSMAWNNGQNVTLVNLNPTGCPECVPSTRYMNNPKLDGRSQDYYPDRNLGIGDAGHVHTNSGIANLAFVLTVQGGIHPQANTTNYVLPVGILKAESIFYLGFTQYLSNNGQFCDARAATIQAARELYPEETSPVPADTVAGAWTAVGVEDC